MKKLQTTDVFNALRLVKSANLREELRPVLEKASAEGAKIKEVGIETFLTLIEAFANKNCEDKFYELISKPLEMEVDAIKQMGLMELMESLKELAKVSDLQAFFTAFSSLITSK